MPRSVRARGWRRPVAALALGLAPLAAWCAQTPLDLAQGALQAINDYRMHQALPALQSDSVLEALAVDHSKAMAQRSRLSHDGFEARLDRAGRTLCVENLAARFDRPDALLKAWLASAGHRANLLEPQVQQVGIAAIDGYITLLACAAGRP